MSLRASVSSDRRALARRVALMVVSSGLPLVGVTVPRNPDVQARRETLKSRRVCETRIGLPGRLGLGVY